MIEIQVEFRGLEELARRFGNIAAINRALDSGMAAWVKQIVRSRFTGMQNYAPPPAGSTYIRTGTLGGGWNHAMHGPLRHAITNPVMYAPYVVGDNEQAWVHRGRWWTAARRVEQYLPDLVNNLATAAASILETGRVALANVFNFGRGPVR